MAQFKEFRSPSKTEFMVRRNLRIDLETESLLQEIALRRNKSVNVVIRELIHTQADRENIQTASVGPFVKSYIMSKHNLSASEYKQLFKVA